MNDMTQSTTARTRPRAFLFAIGGYGGDSFEIRWDGDAVVYVHRSSRNKLLAMERIAPSERAWGAFASWFDENGCWQWPKVCTSRDPVADGTYWNLEVEWDGQRLESGGSNAYPGSSTAEPSAEFRAFLEQLGRLLGGVPLH